MSVSRHHATISWDQGALCVEDTDSKFGTLSFMKQPRTLLVGEYLTLQCGRTLLEFFVEKSWSIFSCFGKSQKGGSNEKEEEKISPQECLPGGGRHSVLFVSRKAYDKLVMSDERLRRPGTVGKGYITMMNKTPPAEPAGGDFLYRQRTMAYQVRKKIDVRAQDDTFIQLLRGDTADDVEGCE